MTTSMWLDYSWMTADENQGVLAVAEGDRPAVAMLVELHLHPIEAFATRMLADSAEAQDVAQEVMLRLWQRASEFDPRRARLSTWLHQIAHNLCIDRLRKVRRLSSWDEAQNKGSEAAHHAVQSGGLQNASSVNVAPMANSLADEQAATVSRALGELPERQRSALLLTYYQALTNREVADIMGISVRALESLLVRARTALKQALEGKV